LSVEDVIAVEALSPSAGWMTTVLPGGEPEARKLLHRLRREARTSEIVWQLGNDSLPANLASAWPAHYSVETGDVPVDLAFLRDLPAGAVSDLVLHEGFVAASLSAMTYLGPGLRDLDMTLMALDDDSLALVSRLDSLKSLQIYDGRLTSRGLSQLAGLSQLQTLHVEMQDQKPSWFAFAAMMPNLVALTGPDETMDEPWDAAQVSELRRMLPGIQVC